MMGNAESIVIQINAYINRHPKAGFEVHLYFQSTVEGQLDEYTIDDTLVEWNLMAVGSEFIRMCYLDANGDVTDVIRPLRMMTDIIFWHPSVARGEPASEVTA